MQYQDKKSQYFREVLADLTKDIRIKYTGLSCNKLADEYGLNDSNLGKIERAKIDCKFITLWKIVEASGLKFSEFAKLLEEKLGDDFKLMDE